MLPVHAGIHPNGQPVFESLPFAPSSVSGEYDLLQSPAFARGIARGDRLRFDDKLPGQYVLVKRGGNLAVTVFIRSGREFVEQAIVPAWEKLGGQLDSGNERLLVLSIHVSCGFQAIEAILDAACDGETAQWQYNNVYNPADGSPLNWWQEHLQAD